MAEFKAGEQTYSEPEEDRGRDQGAVHQGVQERMSFTFRIENDNTDKIIEKTHEAILEGLDAAGVQAVSIATVEIQKDPHRVDTGLLKNSIAHAVVGRAAEPSAYSADGPDKDGKVRTGSYSGTAPDEGPDKPYVMIGTNVEYAV